MDPLTHPDADVRLEPATLDSVDDILVLTRQCVEHMTDNAIRQWDDLYPDRESFQDDIQIGGAMVARVGGAVVAYFALDSRQDPQYAQVDWHFNDGSIAVVHRLMVAPAWQGRGFGRWCMAMAEDAAVRGGYSAIRLEAFAGNPGAIRLYQRCGYRASGTIRFRTGEFTCFEKQLAADD